MPSNLLSSPRKLTLLTQQRGFTLLEVMVALVIFAMLAVAGWQVFESLNKAKERAQIHADALSDIQYAYLQLQNDLNQVTAWQTKQLSQPPTTSDNSQSENQKQSGQNNQANTASSDNNNNNNNENESASYATPAFFVLGSQGISFIRFAAPDPRYQTSPTLTRVNYTVVEDKLIRQQFFSLAEDSQSIDSVVLEKVTQLNWQALLPEPTASFSSIDSQTNSQSQQQSPQNANNQGGAETEAYPMLPKGVSVSFIYQENPIEWLFALPNEAPALASNYDIKESADTNKPPSSNNTNQNNDNQSNDDNNNGSAKDKEEPAFNSAQGDDISDNQIDEIFGN